MLPSEKELDVRINDIVVSYNDAGRQHPLTLIFIHGFPFDKNSWNPQADYFSKKYRCITYDLRGFGKTHFGKQELSIELFADDLEFFMEILQVKSTVLCGLSMGGYIALRAILKYPHRFKGLILSDTQCIADSQETKEKRYKLISQIEASGLEAYAEASLKNLFCEKSITEKIAAVSDIHKTILNTSPATIIGGLKALAHRSETCSMLDEINVPALALCGKEDKVTPPAQAEFLQQHIKDCRLQIIDDAAHLSNLEQPALFNAALESFLEQFH